MICARLVELQVSFYLLAVWFLRLIFFLIPAEQMLVIFCI